MNEYGEDIKSDSFRRKVEATLPTMNRKHMYSGVPTGDYDNSRDEKPWQRVPSTLIVLLLGTYLLLGYLTQLVEDGMPRVVKEVDVAIDNSDTFSEEAALRYLHYITGDQPRVAGTLYHYEKTADLKEFLDSIAGHANTPVRTDWQFATGDYWLNFTPPYVNYFQNVSNVVAVLEGESGFHSNGSIGTSILVNCHYDSVPYAIGASDNALFCAIMAETLSKLSRRRSRLKHNIVFLFNGAEENPLQASYAFLQHPWSRGVTTVVNLDAGGMNGKPNLFQVTDPRVLETYRRTTSRPNAQSFGEFLFSSGMIPSDTDFRIWRDFGHIYGADIAFAKWGHVYHTRYDRAELLRAGVAQCAGDTLLRLVLALADTQDLETRTPPSTAVYYDYLNAFLVTYSARAAHAADTLVVLLACLSVLYYVWLVGLRWSTVQELMFSVLGRVVALLAGVLVVMVLVPIMVATTMQLRYLSQPWLVVPLYWVPYLIGAVAAAQGYDVWRSKKNGLNRCIRTLQAMAATRLTVAAVLLVLLCIPSTATMRYVLTVPLALMSAMSLVSLTLIRYLRLRAWQHLLLEVALSIPTVMFLFQLALRIDALMLPVMGRTPSDTPDYLVAALNVALVVLASTSVSGIELLFSRRRLWMVGAVLSVACLVLMFIPFSPYSDDGPSTQRHYWFHTEIVSHDRNGDVIERTSGVLVTKYDAYTTTHVRGALRAAGLQYEAREDFARDCEARVYCDLPLYRVRFGEYLGQSLFLYTSPPAPFRPPPSLRATRACFGETCTLDFVMTGPPHNLLTIWPRSGVTLTSWSFASPLRPTTQLAARPVYVVVHSTATYSETIAPLNFRLTLIVPLSLQSQPMVEVSHHAHKIHHPEDYTSEYRRLVQAMPRYFNIASFMSIRSNYVF